MSDPNTLVHTVPQNTGTAALNDLAHAAVANWALPDEVRIDLLNISENATYKVEASDGRRWALRIHRAGYHSDNAIRSELAWITDLRGAGAVRTPVAIPGRDGELLQTARCDAIGEPRRAVLFAWESGAEPSMNQDLRPLFQTLGEIAARMHEHAKGWPRPPWFERLTWDFATTLGSRPHWGRWQDGMGLDSGKVGLFGETAEVIRRRLRAFGKAPERFGLVHGDLRLANLLVDGGTVKVIDFDDCGFSWKMYDAATMVSFFEHRAEVPELIANWLEGYRRVVDLPDADANEIATFVMLRRLLLVAWIGSHSETDLAKEMGAEYTRGTVELCREYIRHYG